MRSSNTASTSRLKRRIAGNHRTSYLLAMRAIPGWSSLPAVNRVDTPLAYIQAYVAQLRNARLEVIGHPVDQPERLNRLLDEFIAAQAVTG